MRSVLFRCPDEPMKRTDAEKGKIDTERLRFECASSPPITSSGEEGGGVARRRVFRRIEEDSRANTFCNQYRFNCKRYNQSHVENNSHWTSLVLPLAVCLLSLRNASLTLVPSSSLWMCPTHGESIRNKNAHSGTNHIRGQFGLYSETHCKSG